jgi:kinetochore protein Mis12/MTW1
MDFDRGEYVSKLPGGEEALKETIEELRTKVEQVDTQLPRFGDLSADIFQARLLSYRLALAEKQMDRRLAIAKQRKAEVGFVKEVLSAANCE